MALFRFFKTRQPQAGAEAYAFHTGQYNPVFTLFGGATPVNPPFRPLQPPQLYYPNVLGPTSGLGGLIYDPTYFQPLMQSTKR